MKWRLGLCRGYIEMCNMWLSGLPKQSDVSLIFEKADPKVVESFRKCTLV